VVAVSTSIARALLERQVAIVGPADPRELELDRPSETDTSTPSRQSA
jgi:hypothetical protein